MIVFAFVLILEVPLVCLLLLFLVFIAGVVLEGYYFSAGGTASFLVSDA